MKSSLLAASLSLTLFASLAAPTLAAQPEILAALVVSGGAALAKPKSPPLIIDVTLSNFHQVFDDAAKAGLPVILFYTRDWCAVCGQLEILYRYLAEQNQGKAVFGRVDLDKDFALRRQPAPPYFYRWRDNRFAELEPVLVIDSAGDPVGFRLVPAGALPPQKPAPAPPPGATEI